MINAAKAWKRTRMREELARIHHLEPSTKRRNKLTATEQKYMLSTMTPEEKRLFQMVENLLRPAR